MSNMDSNQGSAENQEAPQQEEKPRLRKSLYDMEMDRFRATAEGDVVDALGRFGFALFHSLPAEEQILSKQEIGIKAETAVDLYNLGVALASKGQFDKALSHFAEALKKDSTLAEAVFNSAVACERLGRIAEAKKHYESYIKMTNNSEEILEVQEHLSKL
jgi:tetratricopeptide (TPR) repeat protein